MGCGGSTAAAADEPLMAAVMPGGGTANAGAGNGGGGAGGALGGAPSAAAPPPPKKKAPPIWDPLTAPFPPTAASLARKVPGRPPSFTLEFVPEWHRASEVLRQQARVAKRIKMKKQGNGISKPPASDAASAEQDEEKKADDDAAPSVDAVGGDDADDEPATAVFSPTSHSEDNVVAGPLADAHVLAALVSLAQHPSRLARLFPCLDPSDGTASQKNIHISGLVLGSNLPSVARAKLLLAESGQNFAQQIENNAFQVRLFYGGLWQVFTVDDLVPCMPAAVDDDNDPCSVPSPLFASCREGAGRESWMLLVEKALAKVLGSYEDLSYATPAQLNRLLTGGGADSIVLPSLGELSTPAGVQATDKVWEALKQSHARHDMLSCTTRDSMGGGGASLVAKETANFKEDHRDLVSGSFYTLLELHTLPESLGATRLVLLRNPRGSQRYEGRWSDGSPEWKQMESTTPDGPVEAAVMKTLRKRHKVKAATTTSAGAASTAATPGVGGSNNDSNHGTFWMDWQSFVAHFRALFTAQVLPDCFDVCQTVLGRWEGVTAAGKGIEQAQAPAQLAGPGAKAPPPPPPQGLFLHNPAFRLRNTAAKKSGPVVLTLCRGTQLCNLATGAMALPTPAADGSGRRGSAMSTSASSSSPQQQPLPHQVPFSFKIVSNQLSHSLNANPPSSSPLNGLVQVSPLHDEQAQALFSLDNQVSLTLPSLPPYVDWYVIPYFAQGGIEGDFVLNAWSNSSSLILDAVLPAPLPSPSARSSPPANPLEHAIAWSRKASAPHLRPGNIWSEAYLQNPIVRVLVAPSASESDSSSSAENNVKLLFHLTKTRLQDLDVNVNMRLLANTAPHALNTSAIGTVSAPAKPGGAVGASAAGGAKRPSAAPLPALPFESRGSEAASGSKKALSSSGKPIVGSLSPFHEEAEGGAGAGGGGACTRVGENALYSASVSYAMLANLSVGREYFLVPSLFMPGVDCEAVVQVYGGAVAEGRVSLERVGRDNQRMVQGRWAGNSAAGPARRKKTFLQNPQFCLRHTGPSPISVVISLLYLGPLGGAGATTAVGLLAGGGASAPAGGECSVNVSLCTFPQGSADPNPVSLADKEAAARRVKEDGKKAAAAEADRKKKVEGDKRAAAIAQANLRGESGPSSAASASAAAGHPSLGVASLRIKSKDASGSHKKKGAGDDGAAVGGADDHESGGGSSGSAVERLHPLSSDFELVSQTSFSGELYKSARLFHLYAGAIQPNHSYFIIPSTSVPGIEGEFQIQVFGATANNGLRLDPCTLLASGGGGGSDFDPTMLASKRGSIALAAPSTTGLASMKIKKAPSEKKKKK